MAHQFFIWCATLGFVLACYILLQVVLAEGQAHRSLVRMTR